MAGLPKKFAKFGFKKGWAMFKRSKGGGHSISGRHSKKSHSKRSYGGGVHHALWLNGDVTAPALLSRPVKNLSSITPKKIISPVVDLALLVAGMALGAGLKKMVPIKNPHLMNGMITVVGVGGSLMTKNRFAKMPLLGGALQSVISETKILLPKVPLAGDDEVMYLEDMGQDADQIEMVEGDDRLGADDRLGSVVTVPAEISADDDRVSGYEDTYMEGEGGEGGE